MKLKIKVTKEILERSKMCGEKGTSSIRSCAIALAVRDIFPHAAVSGGYIRPFSYPHKESSDSNITIPIESAVSDYICKFDSTPHVERPNLPEFEIDITDEVIEKINIDDIKPLLENHPTLELIC